MFGSEFFLIWKEVQTVKTDKEIIHSSAVRDTSREISGINPETYDDYLIL